jgi:AsmA protein
MARHARRLILWTIGSLLALALLAVLGVVVFVYSVDPNIFRSRIETAATQALGRGVRLSGDLRWHLGARIAIESRGGEIANAAGFDGPFAAWRSLRLDVAARGLFQRELHIGRVEIDGLSLQLRRDAMGRDNWSFAPAQPAAADASQIHFQIGSLALRDASVHFSDAATGHDWKLESMNLEAGLPADWQAPVLGFTDVALSGKASGAPLAADGVALALTIPALRVTPAEPALSAPAWQLGWNETRVSGSAQARGSAMPVAQGEIMLQAPSLRRLLRSVAVDLPPTRDPKAYGALRAATRWNYSDGGMTLDAFDALLDATHVQGRVTLPRLSPLSLRFDLAADRLDADRYREPEDAKNEPFELPLAALKALDAKGVLRIREVSVAGAAARELTIDVD